MEPQTVINSGGLRHGPEIHLNVTENNELEEKHEAMARVSASKIRPVIANLSLNPGAEIVRYARRHDDILSLGQGEGDRATPDFIVKGVEKALSEGKTFYGPVLGQEALRQEIANYYAHIYNLSLPTNRIFVTSSGTTAMHLALTAILDPGDEVVAVTPIWKNLLGAVELCQSSVNEVALDNENGQWSLDLDKLFDAITKNTKALLITTPSNPTGWMMNREDMQKVMEFARARNIWIISDEVYSRVVYEEARAPSFLDVAEPDDRLFTVNSFSKSWAMTGWRLGWLTGPADAECALRDIALYDNMGAPTFTQYGGIEALRHGEDFIREQLDLWRGNRDLIMDRFANHNRIRLSKPESAFYAFFKIDGEPDCMTLAKRLIDEEKLGLAPGCAFGKIGRGYMRMSFAVSRPRLEEALDRLEKALL